jgi:hypothetical protein
MFHADITQISSQNLKMRNSANAMHSLPAHAPAVAELLTHQRRKRSISTATRRDSDYQIISCHKTFWNKILKAMNFHGQMMVIDQS